MTVHINSHLAAQLDGAYRIVQTLVLRSKRGDVYTIDVGESLFGATHPFGAKITLAGKTNEHVGVCHGTSLEQVINAAQQTVAQAICEGELRFIPAPHRRHAAAPTHQAS
jgi:hypothetical protein